MTTHTEYSTKLLQALTSSLFITIPQTTINYEKLHTALSNFTHTKYLLTKLEQHEDKGLHIHIIITLLRNVRISAIHKIIKEQDGEQIGMIDYQKPKHIHKSINYLKKDETSVEDMPYLEFGEIPKQSVRQQAETNEAILDAIQKAEQGNLIEALDDIKNIDPMKYIQYKEQIKANLTTENKTIIKYDLPNFNIENVTLNEQQQKVWDLLQEIPKTRRIIWVSGDYGSGKSFLYNYINANHKYRLYNAGSSASMDNVVYGYDEEGVIAWDLPRTFDFETLGNSISAVIEKFSDFGQTISSKKYNGKTQYVRGHCLVFSNSKPLDTLLHRDVIHINLSEKNNTENKQDGNVVKYELEIKPSETQKEVNLQDLSSCDEEEIIKQEDTIYPDIKKIQKGCLVKYIKRYRTSGGYVSSQTLNTLDEAIQFMPLNCKSIINI